MSIVDLPGAIPAISVVGAAGIYAIGGAVKDAVSDLAKPKDVKSVERFQRQMRALEGLTR